MARWGGAGEAEGAAGALAASVVTPECPGAGTVGTHRLFHARLSHSSKMRFTIKKTARSLQRNGRESRGRIGRQFRVGGSWRGPGPLTLEGHRRQPHVRDVR